MADVNRGNRPLSPHLTVYKLPLTARMSIFHRITGAGLTLAALLVVWWFLAAASGPEAFARADGIITSWLGGLVLIGSVAALWYHTLYGLRHLVWDTGAGFDLDTVQKSGLAILGATAVLTLITIIVAF